jgi:hypothetical protein
MPRRVQLSGVIDTLEPFRTVLAMNEHQDNKATAPTADSAVVYLTSPEQPHEGATHVVVVDEDGHFYGLANLRIVLVGSKELDGMIDGFEDSPWWRGTCLASVVTQVFPEITEYDLYAEQGLDEGCTAMSSPDADPGPGL